MIAQIEARIAQQDRRYATPRVVAGAEFTGPSGEHLRVVRVTREAGLHVVTLRQTFSGQPTRTVGAVRGDIAQMIEEGDITPC